MSDTDNNVYYTNVDVLKDKILFRGIRNGKKVKQEFDFEPSLYVETKGKSDAVSLYGTPLKRLDFSSISDAKDFVLEHSDISNFKIYGSTSWVQQFIGKVFKEKEIQYQFKNLRILSIDIETETELGGFPNPKLAEEKISLITIVNIITQETITFSYKDVVLSKPSITVLKTYNSEEDMLEAFVNYISSNYPNVITGWNISGFDIPYLSNRIKNVLGDSYMKMLSPWGRVYSREFHVSKTQTQVEFEWVGVAMLDYMQLYSKFAYKKLEDNKLNTVAKEELGEEKIDNPYLTFREFYTKDYPLFVEYNIHDTILIYRLEAKLKLLELIVTMAYDAKCNYSDIFSPVKTWESVIYHELCSRGIQPHIDNNNQFEEIAGAYVQQPEPNKYSWVVSFDATSLYPSIIMSLNMSPETLVEDLNLHDVIPVYNKSHADWLIENEKSFDIKFLIDNDYAMAANGQCFRRNIRGIFPVIIDSYFGKRKTAKNQMLQFEKEYQETGNSDLLNIISALNNKQLSAKILMNALFGAMANEHFKYFDTRIAEGITLTGQYIIKKVGTGINEFLSEQLNVSKPYVFYSDTDSVYIELNDLVKKNWNSLSKKDIVDSLDGYCKDVLNPAINNVTDKLMDYLNVYDRRISFKREVIADSGVWVAKKRYALNVYNSEGVSYDPPKLKIMGLEIVRSSTPEIVRKSLKDAVKIILNQTNDDLISFIEQEKKNWNSYSPIEISFPRRVNGLDKYIESNGDIKKGAPIHVRGSIIFNNMVDKLGLSDVYKHIEEGEPIHYVYLKEPNTLRSHVISFTSKFPEEFNINRYVDYSTMFEKAFLDPLKKIVESAKWEVEKRNSLEGLFG